MSKPVTDMRLKLTNEQRAEIVVLRGQGWTLRALAERFNVSQSQIRRVLGAQS